MVVVSDAHGVEYCVFNVPLMERDANRALTDLAAEGWRVVGTISRRTIILERPITPAPSPQRGGMERKRAPTATITGALREGRNHDEA